MDHSIEILGTVLFACAVIHTFVAGKILKYSHHFPVGSGRQSFFHLLGEIEVVFGIWAAILMIVFALSKGIGAAVAYQESLHFTEAIFVFCIMVMAATKPVMRFAETMIQALGKGLSQLCQIPRVLADVFVILFVGPLSGSFITEPAAMTVTALLLNSILKKSDRQLLYMLLGVLFVNVSVGGALTPFAAPPILMVAKTWGWDFSYVFTHFGWKSMTTVFLNSIFVVFFFRNQIRENMLSLSQVNENQNSIPLWVTLSHYIFLALLVASAHHASLAVGIFLLFLGLTTVTGRFQERLRIKESLLVAFFLGGIIMFGAFQKWWLSPLLASLDQMALYLGASALTAVTDNAALTYLGSQVEGLSVSAQYYLVAGAIAGGGLTIIANAPNAAGFSILQKRFPDGLNPFLLLKAALVPTIIAIICLGYFPDL